MRGSAPGERRGGRQRGTPNKRTEALAQAQAEASEKITAALGPDAFDADALSFLQVIYRDKKQAVEVRLQAARAAISFETPQLAATELSGPNGGPIETREITNEDRVKALTALMEKMGLDVVPKR
jgi:hypothetical protein